MSSSKQSPSKISLNMTKGKSPAISVPIIRYHASDDELDELYTSTDDEKQMTPDSERASPKQSPKKSCISFSTDGNSFDDCLERHSASVDENLSEGIPPSDPWKVLSNIKGKITKTFEERLCDMKNERKKSKHNTSRDTSSVSDYEDFGDVTPTEENGSDKQEMNSSPILRKRTNSSRFVGFSYVKTGLKAKELEDDSVESGIEASELAYEGQIEETDSCFTSENNLQNIDNTSVLTRLIKDIKSFLPETLKSSNLVLTESDHIRIQLKNRIYYQLLILVITLCCCYFIPLPKYFMGICAGIFVSILFKKIYKTVVKILIIPVKFIPPALAIPAVEEHVIVEKFEGWLNELPYSYKPDNYHVARTKPVFFKLQGDVLQVLETRTRIPKRAVWDEPKLKPKFTKKRIYYLAGAKVELLPSGLIRRRRWSKKYPICITIENDTLKDIAVIENSSDDEPQQLDSEIVKIFMEEEETDDDVSQSKDNKDIFEDCQDDDNDEEMKTKLYIFARTDRQKEDWFRRLVSAIEYGNKKNVTSSSKDETTLGNSSSPTSNEIKPPTPSTSSSELSSILSYQAYMMRYTEVSPTPATDPSTASGVNNDNLWLNALLGRILFDMHKCPDTINVIQDKIQRKLSNIKLPYFMESLLVSELVIGQGAPIINKATKPTIDERGLWFDLDIVYEGSLTMTIETKLNLMKLKRTASIPSNSNDTLEPDKTQPARSPMFDSDLEDSPETSTEDEDSVPITTATSLRENTPTQSSGWKFLNMVDKLASNKYFQHATELSYIKRAMVGVSNTEIRLMVSISSIEGSLSVNIPPPPSDRFWYGFKPVPKISLTAKPAVGERALNIVYITKWIETKLLKEFEKVVVIPNMDDLIIPLCPNYPYKS